ncbi:MAG: four helix bundle protein [bacterium]|nr:four helix bundle protein [bacterium]
MSIFTRESPAPVPDRNEHRNENRNENRSENRNENRNEHRHDRRHDHRHDRRDDHRSESPVPADKLTDFQQLNVWQKAHKLALEVFAVTRKFPKEEREEMARTVRRIATVIPAKIAEGFMRRHPRDKEASYRMSQDAIEELKYHLILSRDLGFLKDAEEILMAVDEVARMLTGLVRSARHGN